MKVGASEIKPGAQIEEGLDLRLKEKSQMKSLKRQKSSTSKDLQKTPDWHKLEEFYKKSTCKDLQRIWMCKNWLTK